jgi:hypothetical protein
MKKTLVMLMATTAFGLASSAYAADEVKSKIEYKKDGGYESTRSAERTTASGATVSSESKVDVDVDNKGRIDKTVKVENATNPKGLLNEKKDEAETKIEEKARGGYKQVTTRKALNADGTDVTYKTTTNVDIDDKGNVTTTATTEKTVNPKGLMNEKTTTTKTKSVNGQVIEKKVD